LYVGFTFPRIRPARLITSTFVSGSFRSSQYQSLRAGCDLCHEQLRRVPRRISRKFLCQSANLLADIKRRRSTQKRRRNRRVVHTQHRA
jgi:hypothetical protein